MNKLLFVVPLHSPHAARWVSQLANTEWDVHVFGGGSVISPLFGGQNITVHTVWPTPSMPGVRTRVHRDCWPYYLRGRGKLKTHLPYIARALLTEWSERLAKIIIDLRPSIVHSLKMPSSRLVFDAFQYLPPSVRPPWVYSIWGIGDILAKDVPAEKTRTLLESVDYLMADNPRDLSIAADLGFHGIQLGVFPGGGGYPLEYMRAKITKAPSKRRTIALKGYDSPESGQALRALEAIRRCKTHIQGHRLVIHSAKATHAFDNFDLVRSMAIKIGHECDIPVVILPYSPIEEIWKLFSEARISIAISLSDGTPNTLLESMAVGSFPIQSDTGGLEQWIVSGTNGFLVPSNDTFAIADSITNAMVDDALVDGAAQINEQLTNQLHQKTLTERVLQIYRKIATSYDNYH